MNKPQIALHWLSSISIGSYITSLGFYLWKGTWEPLAICSGVIGFIYIIQRLTTISDF